MHTRQYTSQQFESVTPESERGRDLNKQLLRETDDEALDATPDAGATADQAIVVNEKGRGEEEAAGRETVDNVKLIRPWRRVSLGTPQAVETYTLPACS